MAKDVTYINGIVATKEKVLLKDKVWRMSELPADAAFRLLMESGYGSAAEEVVSVYDYEKLVSAEEAALDAFIRAYAPSKAEEAYLLAPRDFHNAKAMVKAERMHTDPAPMLAPQGLYSYEELSSALAGTQGAVCDELFTVMQQAKGKLADEDHPASGADIGTLFLQAQFAYVAKAVKHCGILKRILAYRADVTNLLTAFRSEQQESAEKAYITGGTLKNSDLAAIFTGDLDALGARFAATPYGELVSSLVEDKRNGKPYTQAERALASAEEQALYRYRYDMSSNHPFLWYVFRRRNENANVRILFVCALAGMNEHDVKRRLRSSL